MSREKNVVTGSIKMITCRSCNSEIPLFAFDSETDVDSVGLCSAAQCNDLRVVVAETTLDEWKMMESGEVVNLQSRIVGASGVEDLHILLMRRIERGPEPAVGVPFSEFRKAYKPPVVIYSCPCCNSGDAVVTQEYSVPEFEELGGRVVTVGSLVVNQ
jgi:hypothetical protein